MRAKFALLTLIAALLGISNALAPIDARAGIVAFHDDFEHDTVGEVPGTDPPGAPDEDSLISSVYSGSITVESDVLGLTGKVILVDREDSPSIGFTAVPDPDLQFCERYTVRWRAAIDRSVFFFACAARSPNRQLMASVEYRLGGAMSFSGSGRPISNNYVPNVPQLFEMALDIPNKQASLSIDGVAVPEAQDVRFTQVGADGLSHFGCSPGGLETLRFAADDIHIEGFACQGVPVEQRSWSEMKAVFR